MKALKGKLSYRSYTGIKGFDMATLPARLALAEFVPYGEDGLDIRDMSFGWVNPKYPYKAVLGSESQDWIVGSYIVFAIRIDEMKYDKVKFDIMLAKMVKESGYTHVSTETKREMGEKIKKELRKKNQPRTKIVEAFYDLASERLFVLSKSTTDAAYFENLFDKSFGNTLGVPMFQAYITDLLFADPKPGYGQLAPKQFLMNLYQNCNDTDVSWETDHHSGLLISDNAIRLSGMVEGNMGNIYTVKTTAAVNSDAVVNQLISHNAAAIDDLKFTMTIGQDDVEFSIKEDSLTPYAVDLPAGMHTMHDDDKLGYRFNLLTVVDEVWRLMIERFRHIKTEKAEDNF